MEWNMEENFSMEWKIFSMEWKKIASMKYRKIVFYSIPYHALLINALTQTKFGGARSCDQNFTGRKWAKS